MSRRPRPRRPAPVSTSRPKRGWLVLGVVVTGVVLGTIIWAMLPVSPTTLRKRAEDAEARNNWPDALLAWRKLNTTDAARGKTWMGEARACLALDLAAQAEVALKKATDADPADIQAWRSWLDILRTEGRLLDSERVGWRAYTSVEHGQKSTILKDLTLALLFFDDTLDNLPDDRTLARLDRWVKADPDDVAARIALHRRVASLPRPGDPDVAEWIEYLSRVVSTRPDEIMAREALVQTLSDLGEIDPGRAALDGWPENRRDAGYARLKGRWDLEYDKNPARAATNLDFALKQLPQDWRSRALLARALQALNEPEAARKQAAEVAALRELLDPANLVPRLAADFSGWEDARARNDLINLCSRAGLERLADAWRREASGTIAR